MELELTKYGFIRKGNGISLTALEEKRNETIQRQLENIRTTIFNIKENIIPSSINL